MNWLAPITAFIIALIGSFWLQKNYFGPRDYPNERSLHVKPLPRTGGLAIVMAVAVGILWLKYDNKLILLGLLLGLALVSFLDDLYNISIFTRLATHILAAAVAILWLYPETEWWHLAILLIALTWMTNLYNFMDGADGLAGGMTTIGFSCYAIAAFIAGDGEFAALNLVVAAAALAFLVFNFHPARIFLGDVGSIPLGFLAGVCGVLGWQNGLWPAWFPVLVYSPFIVDATVTLMKRSLRRERVWLAHSQHYYQKLVHSGLGQRKMALVEYLLMISVATSAVISLQLDRPWQTLQLALWAGFYFVLIYRLEKYFSTVHVKPSPPSI